MPRRKQDSETSDLLKAVTKFKNLFFQQSHDEAAMIAASSRLSNDLKEAASSLQKSEARYLVDLYYSLQRYRIALGGQLRSSGSEPNNLIAWAAWLYEQLETDVKDALHIYAKSQTVGQWALLQKGIGPVLAAGFLAHIDIEKATSAACIWRYAGLDPTVTWGKGQKRPWNARLKTLSWKAGQSFMKVSGRDDAFYGKLYLQRKAYEQQNNEAGKYAAQARQMISQRTYSPDTEAYAWYSRGMLPPSHILARATRWVEKIFLAHWFMVAYEAHYNQPAPRPYAIEHLGHKDIYLPPHWPLIA
jgi:hypothetical protein